MSVAEHYRWWAPKTVVIPVWLVFSMSLWFPVFYGTEGTLIDGLGTLLIGWLVIGWLGIMEGALAWYANPALLLSSVALLKRSYNPAFVLSFAALAIACLVFLQRTMLVNEAGGKAAIEGYGAGLYLWLGAICLNLVGVWGIHARWVVESSQQKTHRAD